VTNGKIGAKKKVKAAVQVMEVLAHYILLALLAPADTATGFIHHSIVKSPLPTFSPAWFIDIETRLLVEPVKRIEAVLVSALMGVDVSRGTSPRSTDTVPIKTNCLCFIVFVVFLHF
jgi:hypothetical protein